MFVSLQVSESNGEVESYRQHFEKFTIDFRTFKERCEQHKKLVQDMGEQTPDVLKYGKENEQVWPLVAHFLLTFSRFRFARGLKRPLN